MATQLDPVKQYNNTTNMYKLISVWSLTNVQSMMLHSFVWDLASLVLDVVLVVLFVGCKSSNLRKAPYCLAIASIALRIIWACVYGNSLPRIVLCITAFIYYVTSEEHTPKDVRGWIRHMRSTVSALCCVYVPSFLVVYAIYGVQDKTTLLWLLSVSVAALFVWANLGKILFVEMHVLYVWCIPCVWFYSKEHTLRGLGTNEEQDTAVILNAAAKVVQHIRTIGDLTIRRNVLHFLKDHLCVFICIYICTILCWTIMFSYVFSRPTEIFRACGSDVSTGVAAYVENWPGHVTTCNVTLYSIIPEARDRSMCWTSEFAALLGQRDSQGIQQDLHECLSSLRYAILRVIQRDGNPCGVNSCCKELLATVWTDGLFSVGIEDLRRSVLTYIQETIPGFDMSWANWCIVLGAILFRNIISLLLRMLIRLCMVFGVVPRAQDVFGNTVVPMWVMLILLPRLTAVVSSFVTLNTLPRILRFSSSVLFINIFDVGPTTFSDVVTAVLLVQFIVTGCMRPSRELLLQYCAMASVYIFNTSSTGRMLLVFCVWIISVLVVLSTTTLIDVVDTISGRQPVPGVEYDRAELETAIGVSVRQSHGSRVQNRTILEYAPDNDDRGNPSLTPFLIDSSLAEILLRLLCFGVFWPISAVWTKQQQVWNQNFSFLYPEQLSRNCAECFLSLLHIHTVQPNSDAHRQRQRRPRQRS